MRTRVTIHRGRVEYDVVDGQGEECRHKNAHHYDLLRRKYGLPLLETPKPEMQQPTPREEESLLEGDTQELEGNTLE